MKLLGCIVLLLLIFVPTVSADELYEVTYNLTELPVSNTVRYNFSLQHNSSIYFNVIDDDSFTNITFPDELYFDNETTTLEFEFNYTIPFFTDFSDNQTILEDIIGVTNSVNGQLVLLDFQYTILHPPIIDNSTNESYLLVFDDGQRIVINSFVNTIFNQTRSVRLEAPADALVDIDCGEFLICPTNVTVDSTGELLFNYRLFVPKDEPSGETTSFMNLTLGNNTGQIKFEWIRSGDDISNLILYDVFSPKCFENATALAECYKLQARYNAEIANSLLERLKQENATQYCENVVNETVKYLEVGNIDPQLLESYEEVARNYNKLTSDYKTLSSEHTSCVQEKSQLQITVQQETEQLSNEFILRRNQLEKNSTAEMKLNAERNKGIVNTIIGWFVFIFIITLIVGAILHDRWVIQSFPYTLMFVLIAIAALLWLITKFAFG